MLTRLLAIWQSDPTFPSGGFAFSNGVEGVAAEGGLDAAELGRVVRFTMRHRWATTDQVALVHSWRAGADFERVLAIDAEVEANALAEPLRSGSRRNGLALLATHMRLGSEVAVRLRAAVRDGRALGHLPVVQGQIWRELGLDEEGAVAASGYGCLLGLVSASVRLGKVGALGAQTVVASALPLLAELAGERVPEELALSSSTPFLDVAAIRHARSDLRLFAN